MTPRQRWAILRLVLGFLQVVCAAAAFALLISTGASRTAVALVAAMVVVTAAKIYVMRNLKDDRSGAEPADRK